ncbi:aminotransferase class IV [Muriicola soli]|uniref:branched-chain-amino-acid transaminase n=1 Tax=Muriicola soli TaxID=2507538 RepID=A0A411E8L3_9FLAO|nr:aminotransferase class IV [Muriicola soli]QBA63917.1 aminotransferase class IV [Muriicola soli]
MINYNGDLLEDDSFYLNAYNRGLTHGDALVETIRIAPGKIYFWEEHYLRLMASMRILRMEIPMEFTMEFLQEELLKTIEASSLNKNTVLAELYVFVSNSSKQESTARMVSYVVVLKEHPSAFYLHLEEEYSVDLYKDFYVQAGMLSNLSTTNRVLQTIGGVYARENGFDDCILLNDQKNVVQTLKGNLFLVNGESIKTPPLSDGCKNGVVRKKIIELLRKSPEYQIEEASISPFELQKADEIFISNTDDGVISVSHYRKATYIKVAAKNILGKLNAVARLS